MKKKAIQSKAHLQRVHVHVAGEVNRLSRSSGRVLAEAYRQSSGHWVVRALDEPGRVCREQHFDPREVDVLLPPIETATGVVIPR